MKKTLSILLITLILSIGYVPSVSAGQCDGLLNGLSNIPPDTPGYEKVLSLAQENCGEALDLAALIALYNSTNGDYWNINDNWLSEEVPHCDWHGVYCNVSNRVNGLNLQYNNLSLIHI